jgi:hypothetical protein
MARSQNSWGLKLFVASIVLFFCLAVTTVEARSVPFLAQLTPEYTGRVNSNNRNFVGQAFAYLATTGNEFHLSVLTVSNINPAKITKVQLYNVEEESTVGEKFVELKSGYQAFDSRISYALGAKVNIEKIAVNIYTKEIGNDRPALSGILVNNRTSYISYLQADQEVTTPSGTNKNDGFASVIAWSADNINYFLNIVVNHDLDQVVTSIDLHAPAASNTVGQTVFEFPTVLDQAAKVFNVAVNRSVIYWLDKHLGYINIHTSQNTAGAIRGQVIPTSTPRVYLPSFPKTSTTGSITALPDGSIIFGSIANLRYGGARNLTGNTTDNQVAEFAFADGGTFDNSFRFPLPVTIKNRHVLRSAVCYFTAATETSNNDLYNVGPLNINTFTQDTSFQVAGSGRRNFQTQQINIDADLLPDYLGSQGLFISVTGTGLTERLYVDEFYIAYYVVNAYANNILKSIFYKGSDAE